MPSTIEDLDRLHTGAVKRIGPFTELAGKSIWSLKQDRYGFMWIATTFNLYRFDGVSFVDYTPMFGIQSKEQEKLVYSLLEDSQGVLWIGTKKNLYRYDRDMERMERVEGPKSAWRIREDSFGRLYLLNRFGNLAVYQYRSKSFSEVPVEGLASLHEAGESFSDVSFDGSGQGWLVGSNGRVFKMALDAQRIEISRQEPLRLSAGNRLDTLCSLFDGNRLWVGTDRSGVFRIELSTGVVDQFVKNEEQGETALVGRRVPWLKKDGEGRVWAGVLDEGMSLFLTNEDRFGKLTYVKGHIVEEGNAATLSVEFDSAGNMWMGTLDLGIFVVDTDPGLFRYESLLGEDGFDFSNSSIIAYLEARDGTQWLAIRGRGLARKKGKQPLVFDEFSLGGVSLGTSPIYYLEEDDLGFIWATGGGRLLIFNPRDGSCESISENLLGEGDPQGMLSRGGEMWLGVGRSVLRIDIETREVLGRIDGLSSTVKCIVEDQEGWVWIGCRLGLHVYDTELQRLLSSDRFSGPDKTLILDRWTTGIKIADEEHVWVASYGRGLRLLDRDFNIVASYDAGSGMISEGVGAFQIDEDGRVWLATRLGLIELDLETGEMENYFVEDGLMSNRFDPRESQKGEDGSLVFQSQKGLLRVYPKNKNARNEILEPRFVGIEIFDKKVPIGKEGGVLKRSIVLADSLVLQSWQSVFTLSYSAMNYERLGNTWFRHRMNGAGQSEWSVPSLERFSTFANLPQGDYTLEVMASNDPEFWEGPVRRLAVRVLPSFWAHWWVIAMMGAALFGLIYLTARLRTRSLNRSRLALERLVAKRTRTIGERNEEILAQNAELERHRNHLELMVDERTRDLVQARDHAEESDRLKSTFLANFSHEIRTPLNAIVGFSNLLGNGQMSEEDQDPSYSDLIKENAFGLTQLIDDVLDISRLESGQLKVYQEPFNLLELCWELFHEFQPKVAKAEAKIAFNLDCSGLAELLIVSDRARVRQILSCFLDNALKFTKEGNVTLSVETREDRAIVSVNDTGIGIPKDKQKHVFGRFRKIENHSERLYRGAGLGLSISSRLAELLNADIELESELGKGAAFRLCLPVRKEAKAAS